VKVIHWQKHLTTSRRHEATCFRLSDAKTQMRLIPQRAGTGCSLQQQDLVLLLFSSASDSFDDNNRYPYTKYSQAAAETQISLVCGGVAVNKTFYSQYSEQLLIYTAGSTH